MPAETLILVVSSTSARICSTRLSGVNSGCSCRYCLRQRRLEIAHILPYRSDVEISLVDTGGLVALVILLQHRPDLHGFAAVPFKIRLHHYQLRTHLCRR
jgi:hypothetical protein